MKYLHDSGILNDVFQNPDFQAWFGNRYNDRIQVVQFRTDENIIEQGIERNALFLLLSGRVCISAILPNGKHCILRIETAPALLGELEMLEMTPPAMSVRALEPCRTVLLPYALCRTSLLSDSAFLQRLAILLGHKEQTGVRRLFHTFSFPLENRLAHFILEMQENGFFLVRKVVAADSLGVSYRHLSQIMGDFVSKGYLKKDGFKYEIKNKAALKRLAEQMDEGLCPV